ncbi:MAG: hypothetical protein H7232_19020 [Aeromicrobium sp.]|nr:hypothetical protein [Burkholderiales bacterium]
MDNNVDVDVDVDVDIDDDGGERIEQFRVATKTIAQSTIPTFTGGEFLN